MRSGATITEAARDIMSALAPVTGTRANGQVRVRARAGQGTVKLPRNWYLVARINGAIREELVFKIARGPERALYPNGKRVIVNPGDPMTDSWWLVDEGGTDVEIVSVVGGARFNLKAGTELVFDPPHPQLELTASVIGAGIERGEDPTHLGGCKALVEFDSVSNPMSSLDMFRSALNGNFPGIVIMWENSEPADGAQNDMTDRGANRMGRSGSLYKENFTLFLISGRLDGSFERTREIRKLLDDVCFWLTDRTEVDGEVASSPSGILIRSRARVLGEDAIFQAHSIYMVELSLSTTWTRYDERTFNDWLLTRVKTETHELLDGERKTTTDQTIDMRT